MVVVVVRIESQVHNVTVACPILAQLSSVQATTTTSSNLREPAHQIWALCKADVQVQLLKKVLKAHKWPKMGFQHFRQTSKRHFYEQCEHVFLRTFPYEILLHLKIKWPFLHFVGVFWIDTDRWNLLWTWIFPALWPCIWATDQMNFTFQCFKDTTSPFSFCNDGFADADIIKTMLLNREQSMKCRQSLKYCWFFPEGILQPRLNKQLRVWIFVPQKGYSCPQSISFL